MHIICHRAVKLTHFPITVHTLTWFLIDHTCTSWAPSSRLLRKHTPHTTPVSGVGHTKRTLQAIQTRHCATCLFTYLLCLLQFVLHPNVCSSCHLLVDPHYSSSKMCAFSHLPSTISCETKNKVIVTINPRTVPLPLILSYHYPLLQSLSIKMPVYILILCLSLLP